jgi:hypothetical protein
VKDFESAMLVATQPLLLVANKSVPGKNPTLDHVAGALFQKETGTRAGMDCAPEAIPAHLQFSRGSPRVRLCGLPLNQKRITNKTRYIPTH